MENFLSIPAHCLSGFLGLCMAPRITIVEMDQKGPCMLAIAEPCFDGAFLSYWCAPEWRQTKYVLTTFLNVLKLALEQFPCIVGITKQKRLIETHLRLGYTLGGELPKFWGGETAYILMLTRENFAPILKRYHRLLIADQLTRNLWL